MPARHYTARIVTLRRQHSRPALTWVAVKRVNGSAPIAAHLAGRKEPAFTAATAHILELAAFACHLSPFRPLRACVRSAPVLTEL